MFGSSGILERSDNASKAWRMAAKGVIVDDVCVIEVGSFPQVVCVLMAILLSSLIFLLSNVKNFTGGSPSKYADILTAPNKSMMLWLRLICLTFGCRMTERISGSCPTRSQCSMTRESMIGCGFLIPSRDKGPSSYHQSNCDKW